MAKASNMSAPVTRGELKVELKQLRSELATKAELQQAALAARAELQQAVLAARADLEIWGGALRAHIDRGLQQLQIDLARHANALHESMATMIRGFDDKYVDLPGRVGRLESAVFAPKPP
jgi:hypothetical protein